MKTVRVKTTRRAIVAFAVLALLPLVRASAQTVLLDLADPSNQADYIIITPASYVGTLSPLADYRAQHDGLRVVFALTDSIYRQFPGTTPDSAVKSFIIYALSAWSDPKPAFVLLGGGVNAVPGHRVQSDMSYFGEDSVLLDSWFALTEDASSSSGLKAAVALGRFPAADLAELGTMVSKTIGYAAAPQGAWTSRSIALADSLDFDVFEQSADQWQAVVAEIWRDTLTGHVRSASPRAWSAERFGQELNGGAALVTFWGHGGSAQLGGSVQFFTPEDVGSITPGSPLALWFLTGAYPWDVAADSSIVLSLLTREDAGAVAVCASPGLHFLAWYVDFMIHLADLMTISPGVPIGELMQASISSQITSEQSIAGRLSLLGDPALIVASPVVAGTTPPESSLPSHPELLQNYPNPFNPTTAISFTLPQSMRVTLKVYNALGQEIATLVDGIRQAGPSVIEWNAQGLASGVYLYRLTAGSTVRTRTMVLLR